MRKLYHTIIQKKAADRKRKQILREKQKNGLSNPEWISQIVFRLVNNIPRVATVLASRRAFEADSNNSSGLLKILPGVPSIDRYNK